MELRQALLNALKLKEISRAGWINSGLKNVESVAAHSWGVSYLALILMPEEMDKERILSMAIFHDLGEAIIGDITPADNIAKEEKHDLELNAINELTKPIKRREKLIDLWHEYEKNITPEAKFVKACDKLDMALQATFYSLKDHSFNPKEFIDSALSIIDDECMRLLIDSTANGKN